MLRLEREPALKKWHELWESMNQEWFKVEVLQDYSGEDDSPSLAAWKNGDKDLALKLLADKAKKEDLSKLSKKSDVNKIRLHIVEKELTPYLEWEIEHYKLINIPLRNEKVYLVLKENINHLELPDGDFCIFDNQAVAKNNYTVDGKLTSMEIYERGEDISYFLKLKNEITKYGQIVR